MSKALVIKNADFSSNALDNISYVDIHCTGITVSGDTVMLVGDNLKLTASVSPANCTDMVTWESSDATIATVDYSGNVTCLDGGSVTITVTCGQHSASIEITCVKYDFDLGYVFTSDTGWVVNTKRTTLAPTLVRIPYGTRVEYQCTDTRYIITPYFITSENLTDDVLTGASSGDFANDTVMKFNSSYTDGEVHSYTIWNAVEPDTVAYFTCVFRTQGTSVTMTATDIENIKAAFTVRFIHNIV